MEITDSPEGRQITTIIEGIRVTVFFGSKRTSRRMLVATDFFLNKDLKFAYLKQIHGDQCLSVNSDWPFLGTVMAGEYPTGDALFTVESNVVLGVVTADCLSVMIYDSCSQYLLAVHAGWKGVVGKIIQKAIECLKQKGGSVKKMHVWIGPHIRKNSFEVGLDIGEQLASSSKLGKTCLYAHQNSEKKYADLTAIAQAQLTEAGIHKNKIWIDPRDTFQELELTSFRRDGVGSGRLLNLIMKSK